MDNNLIIEDIVVGQGTAVQSGDVVKIHYTGYLEDGTIFDSSVAKDVPFVSPIGVGRLIRGWDIGIVGLQIGGKRKLTIPYNLAYGEAGIPGTIPARATLIFEVELLDIVS
jgi:FKBP-type peptidyl-prolyl cis-trans isomerase